jgi:hypothetical protein
MTAQLEIEPQPKPLLPTQGASTSNVIVLDSKIPETVIWQVDLDCQYGRGAVTAWLQGHHC